MPEALIGRVPIVRVLFSRSLFQVCHAHSLVHLTLPQTATHSPTLLYTASLYSTQPRKHRKHCKQPRPSTPTAAACSNLQTRHRNRSTDRHHHSCCCSLSPAAAPPTPTRLPDCCVTCHTAACQPPHCSVYQPTHCCVCVTAPPSLVCHNALKHVEVGREGLAGAAWVIDCHRHLPTPTPIRLQHCCVFQLLHCNVCQPPHCSVSQLPHCCVSVTTPPSLVCHHPLKHVEVGREGLSCAAWVVDGHRHLPTCCQAEGHCHTVVVICVD